jgi:hypothetical protein
LCGISAFVYKYPYVLPLFLKTRAIFFIKKSRNMNLDQGEGRFKGGGRWRRGCLPFDSDRMDG